jgi:hypothetical protein
MNKIFVLGLTVPETKTDCAGEGQRQFSLPNRTRENSFVSNSHVRSVSSESVCVVVFVLVVRGNMKMWGVARNTKRKQRKLIV